MPKDVSFAGFRQFTALTNYLEGRRLTPFVFEILPSAFPVSGSGESCLLIDGSAVAIRKSDLMKAFLYARLSLLPEIFQRNGFGNPVGQCPETSVPSRVRLAARVVLLYDPEHVSAANYLRHRLVQYHSNDDLKEEIAFTGSVLASPLHRHSKSPTLWSYRLWMMKTFRPWNLGISDIVPSGDELQASNMPFWAGELDLVLAAAEQHQRNYHAFQYMRDITTLIVSEKGAPLTSDEQVAPLVDAMRKLTAWCLQHPRDISGFAFLSWYLDRIANTKQLRREVGSAIESVSNFRSKLQWKGESLEIFLQSVAQLNEESIKDNAPQGAC